MGDESKFSEEEREQILQESRELLQETAHVADDLERRKKIVSLDKHRRMVVDEPVAAELRSSDLWLLAQLRDETARQLDAYIEKWYREFLGELLTGILRSVGRDLRREIKKLRAEFRTEVESLREQVAQQKAIEDGRRDGVIADLRKVDGRAS